MNIKNIDHQLLKNIIIDVAEKELMPRFANVAQNKKADNSIVTEADIHAQESIATQIKQHWPNIPLLGEEMTSDEQAALLNSDEALWCLDPLDGTSNFASGIPYFAISLALLFKGEAVLGIVYDPAKEELFFAYKNVKNEFVVSLNGEPLKLNAIDKELARSIAIVDLKRLPAETASRIAAKPPFASQRNFGASALDWCWLATSRSHVYLHGNQNIWDYAAGELIFRAAGGQSITLQGETIFKQALERRSVVAAISESLFHEWTTWLKIKQKN